MIFILYSLLLVALAALPTLLVFTNLFHFRQARTHAAGNGNQCVVSVLIPARNEEPGLEQTVESVLSNEDVELEVIVMDDHSSDRTAAIVESIAQRDARVRLARAPDLPVGWNGKQHACWELARLAEHELLLFMDADVRLAPDALKRMVAEQRATNVALLSGFPRQITISLSEKLLVPMMYFLLLGYLPLKQMRGIRKPEFGAGCGQLFLAKREEYLAVGGHASIRASRHDGLKLPRTFRKWGLASDLFDASDIAQVRMYSGWRTVLRGLLKNATEGIANPKLIGLSTVLLLGAAVLPILSLAHAIVYAWPTAPRALLILATLLSFLPRAMIASRLGHSWLEVLLHPLAVAIFVAVQWFACLRELLGLRPISWRGRP